MIMTDWTYAWLLSHLLPAQARGRGPARQQWGGGRARETEGGMLSSYLTVSEMTLVSAQEIPPSP